MTLATLVNYLCGSREAISNVARCPQAIWIGLLFVLAAGFAREYDGEDLLHEPWHLAIPLGASLLSSAVLYVLVRFVANDSQPAFVAGYREFLTLYWMTAPLALLYAIPVERLLSASDATSANLWLLAIVATWRVLLITRVVSVLYATSFTASLFVVMLFADTIMLVIVMGTPLPIVSIMGGIRISESEQVLRNTIMMLRVLGIFSWPVWLIGTARIVFTKKSSWRHQIEPISEQRRVSVHLWAMAGLALLIWIPILPIPQAEQRLRRQVESALRSGHVQEGLAMMSAHERGDFPPHWDPPPRLAYREPKPDLIELRELLSAMPNSLWVRQVFDEKYGNYLRGENDESGIMGGMPHEQLARHIAIIEQIQMPARQEIVREQAMMLRYIVKYELSFPEQLRERIKKLLADAGVEKDRTEQQNGEPMEEVSSP